MLTQVLLPITITFPLFTLLLIHTNTFGREAMPRVTQSQVYESHM